MLSIRSDVRCSNVLHEVLTGTLFQCNRQLECTGAQVGGVVVKREICRKLVGSIRILDQRVLTLNAGCSCLPALISPASARERPHAPRCPFVIPHHRATNRRCRAKGLMDRSGLLQTTSSLAFPQTSQLAPLVFGQHSTSIPKVNRAVPTVVWG